MPGEGSFHPTHAQQHYKTSKRRSRTLKLRTDGAGEALPPTHNQARRLLQLLPMCWSERQPGGRRWAALDTATVDYQRAPFLRAKPSVLCIMNREGGIWPSGSMEDTHRTTALQQGACDDNNTDNESPKPSRHRCRVVQACTAEPLRSGSQTRRMSSRNVRVRGALGGA